VSVELWCWRHPRPIDGHGRCIGSTDVRVDPRKVRRLASRIHARAHRHGLPRQVWVSPLTRARAVGRALRALGYTVHVDARLAELDFGLWEGKRWVDIARRDIEHWAEDLWQRRPGNGENVAALCARMRAFVADAAADTGAEAGAHDTHARRIVVSHAGWINALRIDSLGLAAPGLAAAQWPASVGFGALLVWNQR
jgi:alpha-ribazole phosphatase